MSHIKLDEHMLILSMSVYIWKILLHMANNKCSGLMYGRLCHCKFNILGVIFYVSEDVEVYEAP